MNLKITFSDFNNKINKKGDELNSTGINLTMPEVTFKSDREVYNHFQDIFLSKQEELEKEIIDFLKESFDVLEEENNYLKSFIEIGEVVIYKSFRRPDIFVKSLVNSQIEELKRIQIDIYDIENNS